MDNRVRHVSTGRLGDWTHAAIFRYLHVGILTAFVVNTFVTSMNVHTSLSVGALVSSCLTLIYVLAEASAQELIAFRTNAREFAMLIHTLILAQVAGVAALVYVVTREAIWPELITLLTSTQERPVCIITPLTAGGPHTTLIHINTGAIVASQLETRLTLAGERARDINTAMLTVTVPALVNVNAFCAHFAITIWTLAGEGAFCVETLLTGLAVMAVPFTLIHIHAAVLLGLETWRARVERLADSVLQARVDLVGWLSGRDDRG